jgi:hypothetical protein
MIPLIVLAFAFIALDIFLVIPLLYTLFMFKADILIIVAIGIVAVLAPMFCLLFEMNGRRRFDIRCDVSYRLGEHATSQKTITVEDRLGFIDILDEKGRKTGAKEWKLQRLGKPVSKFDPRYIEQRSVWWGYWTTKHAHVVAVQGINGEEFEPMGFNPSIGEYKPALSGDRGLLWYKLSKDIENRNKFENTWKEYLPYIIIGGLVVIVAVFQFLTWLKMGDFINSLDATAQNFATCSYNYKAVLNASNGTIAKPPYTIGGIPIG